MVNALTRSPSILRAETGTPNSSVWLAIAAAALDGLLTSTFAIFANAAMTYKKRSAFSSFEWLVHPPLEL